MIHKLKLHPFYQTNGGKSGIKHTDKVRGVPQSQIDQLRGTRDHQGAKQMTWETIKEDYARVGITITNQEAREIREAIRTFTGDAYGDMREAWDKNMQGKAHELTPYQQNLLKQYQLCNEYCKIAPTYQGVDMIHRGVIKGHTERQIAYSDKLFALKPGDKWNNDGMPTSYSSDLGIAKDFSSYGGIILHVSTKSIKNTPSIKGISQCDWENEVFVGDYNFNVRSIVDQRAKGDGHYHIYLE